MTENKKYSGMKIAVVGAGSIGVRHLDNLNALGVKDITVVRHSSKSKKLGLPYEVNEVYSLSEALDKKPDALFICSPTSLHLEPTIQAARREFMSFWRSRSAIR